MRLMKRPDVVQVIEESEEELYAMIHAPHAKDGQLPALDGDDGVEHFRHRESHDAKGHSYDD